jgi:hypothetical protein
MPVDIPGLIATQWAKPCRFVLLAPPRVCLVLSDQAVVSALGQAGGDQELHDLG